MRLIIPLVLVIVLLGSLPGDARSHCEIPCGIYDDPMRLDMIAEHIGTIEKSMHQITELSGADPVNYNQLIRWIDNKEQHANLLQDIAFQYFMNQRVKPVAPGGEGYDAYVEQITLLHRMLVTAMKCKQTTDQAHIEELRTLLQSFRSAYLHE